jgi:hypothetical protein
MRSKASSISSAARSCRINRTESLLVKTFKIEDGGLCFQRNRISRPHLGGEMNPANKSCTPVEESPGICQSSPLSTEPHLCFSRLLSSHEQLKDGKFNPWSVQSKDIPAFFPNNILCSKNILCCSNEGHLVLGDGVNVKVIQIFVIEGNH